MSIDYGVYVGPYARCEVGQVETTEMNRGCLNPACKNHRYYASGGSFCNLCGSAIGGVAVAKIKDAVDQHDVREYLEERLVGPSGDGYYTWKSDHHAHIWLPNIKSSGRHLDTEAGFELYQIPPDQVQAEIDMFQSQFATDLSYLREGYGNLTIHWGVIQDYS